MRAVWIMTGLSLIPIAIVLLSSSCDERGKVKGVYCDDKTPCAAGLLCDTSYHSCYSPDDAACITNCSMRDLGDTDMALAICEMSCTDGGGNNPDLRPMCTPQTAATDCTDTTKPICAAKGTCQPCQAPNDDTACAARSSSTPRCMPTGNTNAGECVACVPSMPVRQSTDCTAASKPICDTSGSCRACAANTECTSGVCIQDGANAGQCAAASQVAYVDNKASVTTCNANGMTHDGNSPSTAFCDIQAAVNTGKPYVLVQGQSPTPTTTQGYSKVTITSAMNVTIIGPGQGSSQPVTIYDPTNVGLTISLTGAGMSSNVILDGIEIGDRTNSTVQDALDCGANGGATVKLTLRRSAILHSSKLGMSITGSDVTMDADLVANNATGGISLTNSDYTIQNSVSASNGAGGPTGSNLGGIQVSGSGTTGRAQIINVTDADNNAKNTAGVYSGLDCIGGAAPIIFNSVVVSNSNVQINPNCTLAYSSFVGGNGTNTDLTNCTDATLFVNSGANPYQPKATVTAPCSVTLLGKGTTMYMAVPAPTHDLTGATRPQPAGSMPDDGAYEAP